MENVSQQHTGWHHSPVHQLDSSGAYMVTCGTIGKKPILTTPERLSEFQSLLFKYAKKHGWRLQAWAIMNNHYHWIGLSPQDDSDAKSLKMLTSQLHEVSTKRLNRIDATAGRKIWYNYWDSHITFNASYYARLKYVHNNPVHHGVVKEASNYPWCSQTWLQRTANSAFVKQLNSLKTDLLKVVDDF